MPNTTYDTTIEPDFRIGGDLEVRRIGYGAMRLADGPDAPGGTQAPV